MKTIKFRIWNPVEKKMVESGGTPSMLSSFFHQTATLDTVHNMPYQQFTGLLDRSGKEIYEDDLIEWTARDNDGRIMRCVEAVSWKNGSFVTGKGNDEETLYDDANRRQLTKQSRVIGNIWENPDLLESK